LDDRDELQALRRMAELEAKAAPTSQAAAPGSEPLPSTMDRLKSMGGAVGKGLIMGGPLGAGAAGMGEGLKQFGQGMDKAAYNAGGGVTDLLAGKVSPEVAGGAGYAANVATQAIPVALGGLIGKGAQPAIQSVGKGVMQSALKPTGKDLASGDAAKAVKTLLDEGVNVSSGGAAKLQASIDALNRDVTQRIATSPATVSRARPAGEIAKTLNKFKQQVNPAADERAILDTWKEFTQRFGPEMSIQKAQAAKQGTYKALAGKYGEVGSAATEAQKALARGLRQGIEKQIPEVAQLNAKESALINALDQTERRVGIAGNRDIGGLAWIANDPKAAAAFFAGRSELFKSIVARMLYSGAGPVTTGTGASLGAALGAESGRAP